MFRRQLRGLYWQENRRGSLHGGRSSRRGMSNQRGRMLLPLWMFCPMEQLWPLLVSQVSNRQRLGPVILTLTRRQLVASHPCCCPVRSALSMQWVLTRLLSPVAKHPSSCHVSSASTHLCCCFVMSALNLQWVLTRLSSPVAKHPSSCHMRSALSLLALTLLLSPLAKRSDALIHGCGEVGWCVR